jgi:hypothetical protein
LPHKPPPGPRQQHRRLEPPLNQSPASPSAHLSKLIIPGNSSSYLRLLFIFLHEERALCTFCKKEDN